MEEVVGIGIGVLENICNGGAVFEASRDFALSAIRKASAIVLIVERRIMSNLFLLTFLVTTYCSLLRLMTTQDMEFIITLSDSHVSPSITSNPLS